MKRIAGILAFFVMTGIASAQGLPSQSLARGTWELTPIVGGGTGLGKSDNTQFIFAGVRVGRVMTKEHLSGWAHGNFELAVDLLPLYEVFSTAGPVYGGGFRPAVFQWNFTRGQKFAPYINAAGGILFSTQNIPPGNTSYVNFTSQGGLGIRIFSSSHHALTLEGAAMHLSNASLGRHNPGFNGSILFTLGYSWFK
ncbi:MAG: acyloxyacyl hydrolase [Candidatus Acidiferrales bacterium]